jgi:transcriptional regulator with XRE-family HTH domain
MEPELERLGRYVLARREQLGMNREAAVRAATMNRGTWQRVERGQTVLEGTYARVEIALQWPPGTVRRIIAGGEPPSDDEETDVSVTHVTHETRGDLDLLVEALGDVDKETQRDMIAAALSAYRAYKRARG